MISLNETKRSLKVALWFVFLTFPLMVIKVDALEKTIVWRWEKYDYGGNWHFRHIDTRPYPDGTQPITTRKKSLRKGGKI